MKNINILIIIAIICFSAGILFAVYLTSNSPMGSLTAENTFSGGVTNTAVTVNATSTTCLARDATRQYAAFVNDSDTVIYLALGDSATTSSGIRLNSYGGSYEINPDNRYIGIITCISASGSKTLTVTYK